MKTTLDLPDELAREVKLRAVMLGKTVKDLVAELLRQGLGMPPVGVPNEIPPDSPVQVDESGLPVVRCRANAPASHMSVEELLKLEQESQAREDLKHAGFPV